MPDQEVADAINEAIIARLEGDPQSTNRRIGREIGVSEIEVARRIRVMDESAYMRLSASLDLHSFGYTGFIYLYLAPEIGREQDVADAILSSPLRVELNSLLGLSGNRPLQATIRMVDHRDLEKICLGILPNIPYVTTGECHVAYKILQHALGVLPPDDPGKAPVTVARRAEELRRAARSVDLDELDINIIAELQVDGRRSSRGIAMKYGVAEGTVRYRLKRMDELNLFRITPARSAGSIATSVKARLNLQVDAPDLPTVCNDLLTIKNVGTLTVCTGSWNVQMVASAQTADELATLDDRIRSLDGVQSLQTLTVRHVYFYDPRWNVLSTRAPSAAHARGKLEALRR